MPLSSWFLMALLHWESTTGRVQNGVRETSGGRQRAQSCQVVCRRCPSTASVLRSDHRGWRGEWRIWSPCEWRQTEFRMDRQWCQSSLGWASEPGANPQETRKCWSVVHFPVTLYPSFDEMSSKPEGSTVRSVFMIVQKKSLLMSGSTSSAFTFTKRMLSASKSGGKASRKASPAGAVMPQWIAPVVFGMTFAVMRAMQEPSFKPTELKVKVFTVKGRVSWPNVEVERGSCRTSCRHSLEARRCRVCSLAAAIQEQASHRWSSSSITGSGDCGCGLLEGDLFACTRRLTDVMTADVDVETGCSVPRSWVGRGRDWGEGEAAWELAKETPRRDCVAVCALAGLPWTAQTGVMFSVAGATSCALVMQSDTRCAQGSWNRVIWASQCPNGVQRRWRPCTVVDHRGVDVDRKGKGVSESPRHGDSQTEGDAVLLRRRRFEVHSQERRRGFPRWVGLQNFDVLLQSRSKSWVISQSFEPWCRVSCWCTFGGNRSRMTGTRQSRKCQYFDPRLASREVRSCELALPCVSGRTSDGGHWLWLHAAAVR